MTAIQRYKPSVGDEQKLPARIEHYRTNALDPPLPDLTARHVFDWLLEAGPTEAGAMGKVGLSWREIDAWAARTRADPMPWEARLLRRASIEYLAESQAAEDPGRPEPWQRQHTVDEKAADERRLRAALGAV